MNTETPTTPMFRPFDDTDWMGMAGAERFPNGAAPLVCYDLIVNGHETLAVLDANGLAIQELTPDGETLGFYYAVDHTAARFMAMLYATGRSYATADLIRLGFGYDSEEAGY